MSATYEIVQTDWGLHIRLVPDHAGPKAKIKKTEEIEPGWIMLDRDAKGDAVNLEILMGPAWNLRLERSPGAGNIDVSEAPR